MNNIFLNLCLLLMTFVGLRTTDMPDHNSLPDTPDLNQPSGYNSYKNTQQGLHSESSLSSSSTSLPSKSKEDKLFDKILKSIERELQARIKYTRPGNKGLIEWPEIENLNWTHVCFSLWNQHKDKVGDNVKSCTPNYTPHAYYKFKFQRLKTQKSTGIDIMRCYCDTITECHKKKKDTYFLYYYKTNVFLELKQTSPPAGRTLILVEKIEMKT